MRTATVVVVLMMSASGLYAEGMASVPWSEFKQFYRESIEREIMETRSGKDTAEPPFTCHLAAGDYQLQIGRDRVEGTARIAGRVLAGKPVPVPLFGRDIVISGIGGTTGGTLLSGRDEAGGIQFLPDGGTNAFEVLLSFFVPVQEDDRSRLLTFSIPTALQNALTVKLTDDLQLIEMPGIADAAGVYHFAAARNLGVRFAAKSVASTNALDVGGLAVVEASPVVLDVQDFFTSFDENGSVLSVLVMEVPAAAGPHLRINAIPDVEIWSLTVNARPRKVYMAGDTWIIPIAEDGMSRVQLALLRKSGKLGLQGSLEASLPATGLPSRTLRVGIALPPRVQLLSLEGPVSPATQTDIEPPDDFVGKPYFFTRSFYKGEGMKLSVVYKETVE